jgi:uncharacterized protein YvpB
MVSYQRPIDCRMRYPLRLLVILSLAALFAGFPGTTAAQPGIILLPGFPLLKQQHSLTCESSAASMATRGRVSERQIMGTMVRNPNPNLGFRGNPDGQQGKKLVDYGVYAEPVHQVLARYGYRSDVLMYQGDGAIMSYINRGWPVIAWITYALQPAQPRLVWASGLPVFLVPHEHAVLIVGYDMTSVTANDPWTAKRVTYDWVNFNRAWSYFDNMALAVEPCPAPLPVSNLRVTNLATTGITWSWNRGANASRYQVTVILQGDQDQIVYRGVQRETQFTLTGPGSGQVYEIVVRSLSPCGAMSSPRQLTYQTPSHLPPRAPTATPTPSAEATITLTASTTPTAGTRPAPPSTPSATVTATASVTPSPTPKP